MNRSTRQLLFVITTSVTALVLWLGTVMFWGPDGHTPKRVLAVLSIGSGLFAVIGPNFFKRDPARPLAQQIAVEREGRLSQRLMGTTSVLMGVALLVRDDRLQVVTSGIALVVSCTAFFRVRRFVALMNGATAP